MSKRQPTVAVLPCPFCGRTPKVEVMPRGRTWISCPAEYVGECDPGPSVSARGAQRAADKWNKRFVGEQRLALVTREDS